MMIAIYIPPVLQALVDGVNHVDVDGSTIGDCVKEMIQIHPTLKQKLFDKRGNLPKGISIFLNGTSAYPEPLSKPVRDGDKIHIFHIVLGG